MNTERLAYLHRQYAANVLTSEERLELKAVFNDPASETAFQDLAERLWQVEDDTPSLSKSELDQIYGDIVELPQSRRPKKLWPRLAGVAAAIALIFTGLYFFKQSTRPVAETASFVNDIKPGTNSATLTLSNGKRIRLTDAVNGELARESGIVVSKTADGQLVYEVKSGDADPGKINTLSTAKGETYILTLPDKSKVWLNAASSLRYAAALTKGGKRVVRLTGEAYFEVAKDAEHPFVVETDRQQVRVLGTHFNINSYADEPAVKTTLLEGSVRVEAKNRDAGVVVLKPGEQASLASSGGIGVQEAEGDDVIAWTKSKYIFEQESMEAIMRTLSRWYDIEVVFKGNSRNKLFMGTISRKENLSKILEKIAFTGGVHFKIEGRRITVEE